MHAIVPLILTPIIIGRCLAVKLENSFGVSLLRGQPGAHRFGIHPRIAQDAGHHVMPLLIAQENRLDHLLLGHPPLSGRRFYRKNRLAMG
jgi:hypothetical protein